ncbi:MAG: response regulator [Candidatus Aminicenantes bacterium]|nr:response regulator [Candidatus Aminicenantes bacterium]
MPNIKVLIVEDEIIIAMDIKHTVENLGIHASDIISSGEESVKKAFEVRPHLVLMDIKLSGKMDGISAAETIYKKTRIPSIFLTAYNDEQTLQRIHKNPQFFSLTKPFSEHELTDSIDKTKEKFNLS